MKKCVLITGAVSGIGLATAREFAAHRHDLILTARREDRLQDIKDELTENFGIDVQTLCFDIRDQKACAAAMTQVTRPVDILINNAGLARGLDFIHEGDLDHWEQMIDTNLKGRAQLPEKRSIPKEMSTVLPSSR
jgi:3-hydroxy acid dehydrogenase/malonic semialdehyde reductase